MSFSTQTISSYLALNPREQDLQPLAPNYFRLGMRSAPDWQHHLDTETKQIIQKIKTGSPWRDVIAANTVGKPWQRKIMLSPSRSFFLELFDFRNVKAAVDLGSGFGQLTLELAKRVPYVLSVETTPSRLEILQAICEQENLSNIDILLADILTLPLKNEAFDFALMCGVFEWLGRGGGEKQVMEIQQQVLNNLFCSLKVGGRIVIAIENRVGLKYLLGERDDHSQLSRVSHLPFEEADAVHRQTKNKPLRARTYDFGDYQTLLTEAGYTNIAFTVAYPDYKLPQLLIPIRNLELLQYIVNNTTLPHEHDGVDGTPSTFNQEIQGIYRSLNSLNINHLLSPSFIISAVKSL